MSCYNVRKRLSASQGLSFLRLRNRKDRSTNTNWLSTTYASQRTE